MQNGEINLDCIAKGIPHPRLIWYKGSQMLVPGPRVSFSADGEHLKITHATASDAGKYTCLAVNEAGDTEAEHYVKVHGKIYIGLGVCVCLIEFLVCLHILLHNNYSIHCFLHENKVSLSAKELSRLIYFLLLNAKFLWQKIELELSLLSAMTLLDFIQLISFNFFSNNSCSFTVSGVVSP